jgi:HlyD family secretion protein
MTANVRIVTDRRDRALKVPNAALRFRPAGAGSDRATSSGATGQRTPRSGAPSVAGPGLRGVPGEVWVLGAGGRPRAAALRLGISDGTFTEVLEGDLREGERVIVGQTAPTQTTTPPAGGPRLRL